MAHQGAINLWALLMPCGSDSVEEKALHRYGPTILFKGTEAEICPIIPHEPSRQTPLLRSNAVLANREGPPLVLGEAISQGSCICDQIQRDLHERPHWEVSSVI